MEANFPRTPKFPYMTKSTQECCYLARNAHSRNGQVQIFVKTCYTEYRYCFTPELPRQPAMTGPKFLAIFFYMLNVISVLPLLTLSFSLDHSTDRQILVLLDDLSVKSSHYLFFTSLQSRGFDLEFKLAADPSIAVKRYGRYLYDGLILFSPSTDRKLV